MLEPTANRQMLEQWYSMMAPRLQGGQLACTSRHDDVSRRGILQGGSAAQSCRHFPV